MVRMTNTTGQDATGGLIVSLKMWYIKLLLRKKITLMMWPCALVALNWIGKIYGTTITSVH